MSSVSNLDPPGPQAQPAPVGRFLAALVDDVTRETARTVATQLGWRNPEVIEGGVEALSPLITDPNSPMFLLADISDSADPIAALDELAAQCGRETRLVAIGLKNDVPLYRKLIGMGVSDYLVKPVPAPVLAEAIIAATHHAPVEPARQKTARLVAMIGSRGGVGVTSLAVSTAWLMSQQKKIVLLDLDLHFGSVALNLDLEPGWGLQDILANPDRIDSLLIGGAMTHASERLKILGAENSLDDPIEPGVQGLAALLGDLANSSDCILVDTPRSLNELARHVLGAADVIAIVTDLSLPAMRDTRRLMALAKGQREDVRVMVIANRVGGVAGEISRADFERGMGGKIDVVVPFDAKAAVAAAERGKALVEVSRNPALQAAIKAITAAIMGQVSQAKSSLFERLLGK